MVKLIADGHYTLNSECSSPKIRIMTFRCKVLIKLPGTTHARINIFSSGGLRDNFACPRGGGGYDIPPPDPSKPPITSEEQTFDSDDCRGQPTFEPGPWTKARELIRPVV